MKSSFRRSMLNSPAWPASREGARRHPHSDIEIHGEAAERLHGFLRTVQNEVLSRERIGTRLTHTNSSPTNPGWFGRDRSSRTVHPRSFAYRFAIASWPSIEVSLWRSLVVRRSPAVATPLHRYASDAQRCNEPSASRLTPVLPIASSSCECAGSPTRRSRVGRAQSCLLLNAGEAEKLSEV
jgi:hypothetical protein